MEEETIKLKSLIEKGDEFIPHYGMSLQKKVSLKTEGLIQNFGAIDLEYVVSVINNVVSEIGKIDLDGSIKPNGLFSRWSFWSDRPVSVHHLLKHFELAYPKVEKHLKELERNHYKMMREIIVYKKEEIELLVIEKELTLLVSVVENSLIETSGDTRDALTKRLYGLTLSLHLLKQTNAQMSLMRFNMEQASGMIQQTISNTVPLWKQQVLQILGNMNHVNRKRPLTEDEQERMMGIQAKQTALLVDLERLQEITNNMQQLKEKKNGG